MRITFAVSLFLLTFNLHLSFAQEGNPPENIILLIGDGMGINYVAAQILSDSSNPFIKFTSIGLSITRSANNIVTESAAGATALATGFPTANGHLSVDHQGNILDTILEIAESKNKSTGLVVTSSITNATPAAFYAHFSSRYLETQIAEQLINKNIDVIIGGGTDFFLPKGLGGKREDQINLLDSLSSRGYSVLNSYEDLKEICSKTNSGKIIGLLDKDGLPKSKERNYSLADLTKIALTNLSRSEKGFFLMVEGSQIDWAGHDKNQDYLLSEMTDFSSSIKQALEFAEANKNTLVIVTADHESGGMAITGGSKDGKELTLNFISGSHTAGVVGIFSYGPFSKEFEGIMPNYNIGQKLKEILSQ